MTTNPAQIITALESGTAPWTTYEAMLNACISYIRKNGATRETCDKLETMLPGAWAAELIADAIDSLS